MAYRRRYMRPFVGTTIVIQDDAITPDKLDDKAVEEKHLGDDVVSERAVGPSAVVSEGIKDGEVKTADLGNLSVTGPKIAENTIPESKLNFTPSTRPLTPAVGSAEILDDAVIESKYGDNSIPTAAYKPGSVDEDALGGDAVTEVKIKDRNVTSDKVALDSLDHTHLKADSVRGTEIQTGAVGTTELSTDAVETIKIKDKNVTESKLEDDILKLRLDHTQLFYDDFIGAALLNWWAESGDVGGLTSLAASQVSIVTDGDIGDKYRINFGGNVHYTIYEKPIFFCRCQPGVTDVSNVIGLYVDANNYILFVHDTAVDGNWHAKTKDGGAESDFDTGIAVVNDLTDLEIVLPATGIAQFYIDGTLRATSGTNVPPDALEPWLEVITRAASTKTLKVDKVIVAGLEFTGPPPP